MSDQASSAEPHGSTHHAPQDPSKKAKKNKKRPLKGIWTHEDGGARPAAWRTRGTGKVRGLARKKGVKAFWKTGFDVHESVVDHPKFQPNFTLPGPKSKAPKARNHSSSSSSSQHAGGGARGKMCGIM